MPFSSLPPSGLTQIGVRGRRGRWTKSRSFALKRKPRLDDQIRKVMKSKINCALAIGAVITFASSWSHEAEGTIERMPAQLESRFALSALPPSIREEATIYLLDPEKGYAISRQGSGNITCLVERTAWELADFRDDIYIPLCYDAAGARAHLKAIIDAAALRAQGMSATALKAEVE